MFSYIPHELSLIKKILAYRMDSLDPFFIFLNNFDSGTFFIFACALLLIFTNSKIGIISFKLTAINIALISFLKNLLAQPRPLILDPELGLISVHSSYGLPSGAAQATTALAVLICYYYRSMPIYIISSLYVLLICISRVYLGAHFFSDVVVGVTLGFVVTKFLLKYFESRKDVFYIKPYILGCAIASLLLLCYFIEVSFSLQFAIGVLSGVYTVTNMRVKSDNLFTLSNNYKPILVIFSLIMMDRAKFIMQTYPQIPVAVICYVFVVAMFLSCKWASDKYIGNSQIAI